MQETQMKGKITSSRNKQVTFIAGVIIATMETKSKVERIQIIVKAAANDLFNYNAVRCDREEGVGGGCITFIKNSMQYRVVSIGKDEECVAKEIWTREGQFTIIMYYNPCRRLDTNKLKQIQRQTKNHFSLV